MVLGNSASAACAAPARAAFATLQPGGCINATNSFAFNNTAGTTSNTLLLVHTLAYGLAPTVTGMSYGGVPLTFVRRDAGLFGSTGKAEVWSLLSPKTGSNNVNITFTVTTGCSYGAVAEIFTGVDTTAPIGVTMAASYAGTNLGITSTVTTLYPNSMLTEYLSLDNSITTNNLGAGQVACGFTNGGMYSYGSYKPLTTGAAGPQSMTHGVNQNKNVCVQIVEITGNGCSASPTPTYTQTSTNTYTASPTPTPTYTNSPDVSATPTFTVTDTFTASPTPTATATPTNTFTASPTGTATPTATATATPNLAVVIFAPNGAVTVDGVMNEAIWASASWRSVAVIGGGGNPGRGSAQFKAVWNATALYIGVQVSDNGTLYANTGQDWNGTAVEIYFEPVKGAAGGSYGASAFQWIGTYNAATLVQWNGTAHTVSAASAATTGTGYVMEWAIPWANLGVSAPSVGSQSGIDVGVDYTVNAGTTRVGQYESWSGGAPNTWGTVQYLAAAPTATASPTGTNTPSPSPTAANTFTTSPQPTATVTDTFTSSPAPTADSTASPTPTDVDTASPTATATASAMDSFTASPTDVDTASPTATASATVSPADSFTASPTEVDTASPTAIETATSSPTDSFTASPTDVDTATATATATTTASPIDSRTVSPTEVDTASPTATASPMDSSTVSPTDVDTASPTATASPMDSSTASPTDVDTTSPTTTATATSSPTESFTVSPTDEDTASPTATETTTVSPTGSYSASPTAVNTASPTATLVQTLVPTASPTPVQTQTSTLVPTASPTPVQTQTSTRVPTASPTPVQTQTSTLVPTASPTPVQTQTFTRVPTASPTPVQTQTSTRVPTASPTPASTLTAVPTPGPLVVEQAWAVPNPNPANFRVKLAGACDQLTVLVYSVAMDKVASAERSGPMTGPYVDVPAPRGLVRGLYFGRVQARRGLAVSSPVLVKFCVIR